MHRRSSEDIAQGGVRLAAAEGKARIFFSDRAEKTALRRTRNDDQRLDKLSAREVRKPRTYQLNLDLPNIAPSTGLAVTARDAAVAGRLRTTTFDLSVGEHMLLTGPNGAGKTTLLRWIASGQPPHNKLSEVSGTVTINGKIAYVPQWLPRPGDPHLTKKQWLGGIEELGKGVLHPAMWTTPVGQLSDGNKRRAQIALAIAQTPEILVIDEPTNYLDLAAIEELETALFRWNGTLIIASHDRWLIEKWQGRCLDVQPSPSS
ncbi:ATP-binding cassette domain-containing protein [Lawsonella clevelandensis]|uniref:ATP-binding cassette domain-containing protein n=1 Tax=Lawsonella clevelandensis TaxID=1528099 RepID=UPI0023F28BA8|nr:ATP-binding cassette domain-containing protein [Lawsonella clevelandensis]